MTVSQAGVKKLAYGNYLYQSDLAEHLNPAGDQVYRVYDESSFFYALYRYDKRDDCYKCVKMFVDTIQ